MPVRNRRSNSFPLALRNACICCAVSMPGIMGMVIGMLPSIWFMLGIAISVDWLRVSSQWRINRISSACERLMRFPRSMSALLLVRDGINAVISTACAWCMIMPCMKATSADETVLGLARLEGGRVLLGSPGAPGCTTEAELCCALAAGASTSRKEIKRTAMTVLILESFSHPTAIGPSSAMRRDARIREWRMQYGGGNMILANKTSGRHRLLNAGR